MRFVNPTLDEASLMAAEALAFHIPGMIEDGEALPEPSRIAMILRRTPGSIRGKPSWRLNSLLKLSPDTSGAKALAENKVLPQR
jgi:hypothetical protein